MKKSEDKHTKGNPPTYRREDLQDILEVLVVLTTVEDRIVPLSAADTNYSRLLWLSLRNIVDTMEDKIDSAGIKYHMAQNISYIGSAMSTAKGISMGKWLLDSFGDHIDLLTMPFEDLPLHLHSSGFYDGVYKAILKWRFEKGI